MADNNTDLSITLKGDAAQFSQVIQKASTDFKASMDQIGNQAKSAKAELDKAFGELNIKSFADLKAEAEKLKEAFNTIKQSGTTSGTDIARAQDALKIKLAEVKEQMTGVHSAAGQMTEKFSEMRGEIVKTVLEVVGFAALVEIFHKIAEAGTETEASIFRLSAAMGVTMSVGKAAFEDFESEALRTGQSVEPLVANMTKLTKVTKDTELSTTAMRTVNDAVLKFGLDAGQAASLTDSFAKSMARNSVAARDLKAVMMEIPGGMESIAKESGMTAQEFFDETKNHALSTAQFITAVNDAVKNSSGAAGQWTDTLAAKTNQLKTAFGQIFDQIAGAGVTDALKEKIQGLLDKLKELTDDGSIGRFAESVGSALATLISAFVSVTKFVSEHKTAIAALMGLAFAAWVGSVGTAFLTMLTTLGALSTGMGLVATAAGLLRIALMSIPFVAVATVVVGLGVAIYEAFSKSKAPIDATKKSLEDMNAELNKVKIEGVTEQIGKIDSDLATKIGQIGRAYESTASSIISSDTKAASEFKKNADDRVAKAIATGAASEKVEADLTEKLKALAIKKAANEAQQRTADEQAKQGAINQELQANTVKNGQLLTAEKKLHDDEAAAGAIASGNLSKEQKKQAEDSAKARIELDKQAVDAIKNGMEGVKVADKQVNDQRTADAKKVADAITNEEASLKGKLEANKESRLAAQRAEVEAAEPLWRQRGVQLDAIDKALTQASEQYAKERVAAETKAEQDKVALIETKGNEAVEASKVVGEKHINEIKAQIDKEIERKSAFFESESERTEKLKGLTDKLTEAEKTNSDKIITLKKEEVAKYQELLTQKEAQLQKHAEKLAEINDKIAGKQHSYEEDDFKANLRFMDDGAKKIAIQERIMEGASQLAALRAQAATEEGKQQEATIKKMQDLESELRSYNSDELSLTKTGVEGINERDAALSRHKENNRLLSEAVIGAYKDEANYHEKSKEAIGGQGGAIDTLKEKIATLGLQMSNTAKNSELTIKANIDDVKAKVEEIKKPTKSDHTIKPDGSAAEAEINRLKLPTSSTHTIYVKTDTSGSGGVQTNAGGGLIEGEGTGTSDSILSRVSNGEFVVKAASVQKFGSNFFNSLNQGYLPATRGYSVGGLVGGNDKTSAVNDTMNINLTIGGNTFKVQSARDQAMGLASALQQLSRAA